MRVNWTLFLGLVAVLGASPPLVVAQTTQMLGRDAPTFGRPPNVTKASDFAGKPDAVLMLQAPTESQKRASFEGNQIGFARQIDVPTLSSTNARPHIRVQSPGAALVRAELTFFSTGTFTIAAKASNADGEPVEFEVIIAEPGAKVWSPVSFGDSQDIVIRPADTVALVDVRISRVGHMVRSGMEATKGFGDSDYCQVDYKCVFDVAPNSMRPGLLAVRDSVAHMIYAKSNGNQHVCTGTLLNSAKYPLPLFLTAEHCMSEPTSVASLNTFWFYKRDTCGSGPPSGTLTQLASGATALAIIPSLDAALVGLNQMPPAGAQYSGWNAGAVAPSTLIFAAHHPEGDALKSSFGTVVGTNAQTVYFNGSPYAYAAGTFHLVDWEVGVVEGGSSGSSLFTYRADVGAFQSRGTLTGGGATCSSIGPRTYYSRLENFFPYVASILTEPLVSATTTVVEYFHAGFGHYFVTGYPNEIQALDTNPALKAAWARTGQTFKGYAQATSGAVTVHRFFTDKPIFGGRSSHFYTGLTNEYNALQAGNIWTYEGPGFYVRLPTGSTCSGGHTPVYRMYNNGQGGAPNHRFTTQLSIYNDFVNNRGWAGEGVVFCAPN